MSGDGLTWVTVTDTPSCTRAPTSESASRAICAVVVGSAIVRRMGECGAAPDFVDRIVSFVTPLTAAAHRARE